MSDERHRALSEFLRARRAEVTPPDVGLPEGERRRGTGLRREDVAELAGISLNWYALLESGAPIRVSPQVLGRVALALRLDRPARAKLFALAIPELSQENVPLPAGEPQDEALENLIELLRSKHAATLVERRAGNVERLHVSTGRASLTYTHERIS